MRIITVDNVNEALPIGLRLLAMEGEPHESRAGLTLRMPEPVATVYRHPRERVLFDPVRNANPFFHFFEALWLLRGREDVGFLAHFNSQMPQYSDNGTTFHGSYGARLRGRPVSREPDQIDALITLLYEEPDTRRGALQIWDHTRDLGVDSKDVPCNMMVAFRRDDENHLHMTVFNRSNDVIWGAYGANAVQFSMLLEYVAARAGMAVGTYTQVSNDFHVYESNPYWRHYTDQNHRVVFDPYSDRTTLENLFSSHSRSVDGVCVQPYDLFADPMFEEDLEDLFDVHDGRKEPWPAPSTHAMERVVIPMYEAWAMHKAGHHNEALAAAATIAADDWRVACELWLLRAAQRKGAA